MKKALFLALLVVAAGCSQPMLQHQNDIINAANRLFICTDNRDWACVQDVFAPEVLFDMTSMGGGQPEKKTPAQITELWDKGLKSIKAVHHQAGNYQVTVNGNEADLFCYGIAFHYFPNPTEQNTRLYVGSYNEHFVKSEKGWKIDRFKYNLKFMEGNRNPVEKVILNSDGTWTYSGNPANVAPKAPRIETSKGKFVKPRRATYQLKSAKNRSVFWINKDKWLFAKGNIVDTTEFEFQLKGKDLYGMAITERNEMPLEALAGVALENAQVVAPDAKVVEQEYRIVNGKKVLYVKISGTRQNVPFLYQGYYYSDASGSTQFLAYCTAESAPKYEAEINDLLNGLAVQ